MKRKLLFGILLAIIALILIAVPVLAIDDPVSLQLLAVYVYEDCLEDGDVGVLVDYYVDYTGLPTETITEAYLVIFLDTDGTTQLASVGPYAFVDNGYGRGLAWIYFTPAQASAYSLDVANKDLYTIRLVGNPTVPSGWTGDPPSTTAAIDYWQEAGDTSVIVALRILYYANLLEGIWVEDMIESTALGNRLTTVGEAYFTNVIPSCRTIAPSTFASSTITPDYDNPDYETEFGAVMADGTGTVVGSPITLVEDENAVNVTAAGTFTLTLSRGTVGTGTNGTGVVTGSPVSLVAGTNTITVPVGGEGTLVVDVYLDTTQTKITSSTSGTAFDLSDLAERFHMSTMWMSGIVWFGTTLLICAATFNLAQKNIPEGTGVGKITFLMFNLCFIGGAVLGLLPILWEILLFLGCDVFIGYVIFFRPANV